MEARTSHITVACILHISVYIDEPVMSGASLKSIDVLLNQMVKTRSRKDPLITHDFAPEQHVLKAIPALDLQPVASTSTSQSAPASIGGKWIIRLPDDDHCRPTTWMFSDDAIKIEHTIEFSLNLESEGQARVVSIKRPIHLLHCLNAVYSTVLPVYTEIDPKPPQPTVLCRARPKSFQQCVCVRTWVHL